MAVVLLDVEGEYTHLHKPTPNAKMKAALADRGLEPQGLPPDAMTVYHLVGRETANPDHPHVKPFSLQFARLSPYAACEILGLTEAQQQRFLRAYDITKEVMRASASSQNTRTRSRNASRWRTMSLNAATRG